MKTSLVAISVGILWILPLDLHAKVKPVLWVHYFENHSQNNDLDKATKGITQMLITDLSKGGQVRLVERDRLASLQKEIRLGSKGFIDPKTAVKAGKGVGATHLLTGTFVVLNDTLRIDFRLVNLARGEIVLADKVMGKTTDFFDLELALVDKILSGLGKRMSRVQTMSMKGREAIGFKTLLEFSEALNLMDEGDLNAAKQKMERAVQKAPRFEAALSELDTLDQLIDKLQDQRSTGLPVLVIKQIEALSSLDPEVCNTFRYSYKGMVQELIDAEAKRDNRAVSELRLYQVYAALQILLDAKLPDRPCGNISPNEAAMGAFLVKVMQPRICSKSDRPAQKSCIDKALAMRADDGTAKLAPDQYEQMVLKMSVDYLERFPVGQHFSAIKKLVKRIRHNMTLRAFVVEKRPGGAIDQFGYKMIAVKPGTFQMGIHPDRIPNKLQKSMKSQWALKDPIEKKRSWAMKKQYAKFHEVSLTRDMLVGATEVPQALYEIVMKSNPSRHVGPKRPVDLVKWIDAIRFCNRLSILEGLEPVYLRGGQEPRWDSRANGYRLLTEAEWEYVARAGTPNTAKVVNETDKGWFRSKSNGKSQPVGTVPANAWGFYDLLGNVSEWTWDTFIQKYNWGLDEPEVDPNHLPHRAHHLVEQDVVHVARGGAFNGDPFLQKNYLDDIAHDPIAFRWTAEWWRSWYTGFRIARYTSQRVIEVTNTTVEPAGKCAGLRLPVEKEVAPAPRYLWWSGERWWMRTTRNTWAKAVKKWKGSMVWPLSTTPLGLDVLESDLTSVVKCDYRSKYEGGPGIVSRSCYQQALARNPEFQGLLQFSAQFGCYDCPARRDPNYKDYQWSFRQVRAVRNTTRDKKLAQCIAADLKLWRIGWESNRRSGGDYLWFAENSCRSTSKELKSAYENQKWCQNRKISFTLNFSRESLAP